MILLIMKKSNFIVSKNKSCGGMLIAHKICLKMHACEVNIICVE